MTGSSYKGVCGNSYVMNDAKAVGCITPVAQDAKM